MLHLSEIKNYSKELLKISLPIIMGNLGFILIGAGDVLVAGRHSTDTLAAISIANAILSCIFTFGIGLVASTSPVLSNYRGEKKSAKKYFYPTIRFALTVAFFVMLAVLAFIPLIDTLKFDAKLTPMIKEYMFISAFAVFGGYLHAALKEFLQAFEIVLFPNLLTVFSVFLNIILNVILVFGFGVIPAMGVVGLAVASLIVRYFMGLVLLVYCLLIMKHRDFSATKEYYKSLVKVGLPMSMAILIEFVAFNSIAVIMGKVAGVYAAAQNLVCTLTNISFMVPFAISNAIAVKVGFSNGAKNFGELKKYSYVGILLAISFMLFSSVIFAVFPENLVRIFTTDESLIKICVPILYILAFFQVFDGLQVALSGIYKGLKRTKIVMLSNFLGYWVIAIPVGYTFAFQYNKNLIGFWYGILVASFSLCMLMSLFLRHYFKLMQVSEK